MSRSKSVAAALTLLLFIGPGCAAQSMGRNEKSLDDYIRASMRTARIPGLALAVVRGDNVAYLKGYGTAAPDGRPVTPETPFILGSTSKSFTALAVMQLVEAGKIALDAPVITYLPWFRTHNATESARITVRHLLHHTSGLRTDDGRHGLWDNDQSSVALETGVRELSSARLRQPAGQHFEYSNENYNTLGLIVQTVSGTSYEDYVRSAIFAPLQMTHSAAALSDAAAAEMASGYRYWFLWPVKFDAPYPRRMAPAGFLISSAKDMAHYIAAQLNGGAYGRSRLLSAQGIVTLHTPGATISPSISYGMGWAIRVTSGSTSIWHDGDVSNFHSHLRLLPDQHLGFVVLLNVGGFSNGTAINKLVDGIGASLLGHTQAAPTDSPWIAFSRLKTVIPLLIAILWASWSIRSLRTRLYLPLVVDLSAVAGIWILIPVVAQTPIAAIALFAPDAFAVVIAITGLAVGCAIARTLIALRSRRVIGQSQGMTPAKRSDEQSVTNVAAPDSSRERFDVVVIGAGQAGLAIGHFLARAGRRFLIVDGADSVGAAWRNRWDSLVLFTPRRFDNLPGLAFPGDPDSYPTRDEVVAYLEQYAAAFKLPIELKNMVRSLDTEGGRFVVTLDHRQIEAGQVVVATGPFQVPRVPALADGLVAEVFQLHSAGYRRPSDVPPGTVLVAGGGNSGLQIARELAATHTVHLAAGSRHTPLPQRLFGRDIFWWLTKTRLMTKTLESRLGRWMRDRDPSIGSSLRQLKRRGVGLRSRVVGASNRTVRFADGTALDVDAVIWATGYRPDYSWIKLPVADADGRVRHRRGVSDVPGLYFLGLSWQHTRGSALLGWVKDDAEFIAEQIAALTRAKGLSPDLRVNRAVGGER